MFLIYSFKETIKKESEISLDEFVFMTLFNNVNISLFDDFWLEYVHK